MQCRAQFTFRLGERISRVVKGALGPETSRDVPRSEAKFEIEGDLARLEIVAEDTGALRAAANSYLRWIDLAMQTAELSSVDGRSVSKE